MASRDTPDQPAKHSSSTPSIRSVDLQQNTETPRARRIRKREPSTSSSSQSVHQSRKRREKKQPDHKAKRESKVDSQAGISASHTVPSLENAQRSSVSTEQTQTSIFDFISVFGSMEPHGREITEFFASNNFILASTTESTKKSSEQDVAKSGEQKITTLRLMVPAFITGDANNRAFLAAVIRGDYKSGEELSDKVSSPADLINIMHFLPNSLLSTFTNFVCETHFLRFLGTILLLQDCAQKKQILTQLIVCRENFSLEKMIPKLLYDSGYGQKLSAARIHLLLEAVMSKPGITSPMWSSFYTQVLARTKLPVHLDPVLNMELHPKSIAFQEQESILRNKATAEFTKVTDLKNWIPGSQRPFTSIDVAKACLYINPTNYLDKLNECFIFESQNECKLDLSSYLLFSSHLNLF